MAYLEEESVENLGRMLLSLTQEVWAMRDRMAITELLLAERAGISGEDIDNYVADAKAAGEIETLRTRFANKVIGAPLAAQERSVDQILARAGLSRPQAD